MDGSIVRISKNSDEIGIIKNGDLVPNKYGASGSPIGDPEGGYQLYKNGDNYQYKRTPDLSGYSQADLSKLKNHPNAHTLERHGHDVSDEALIKRANFGIAPDGSTLNNTPPYIKPECSSKFASPNMVKEALQKTGPNTSLFQNWPTHTSGTRKNVRFNSNGAIKYGKGVKKNSEIFENMYSIEAKCELIQGQWKLVSMHPIKP